MKKLILMSFLAAALYQPAFSGTPVETTVPVDNIYVPKGFDSNDNSEVIVGGWLPNLCHKTPKTKVHINGNKIDITLTALKYDETNPFCPTVMVPFIEAVDVGVLDKGVYKVSVNRGNPFGREAKMMIFESSSDAVDDYAYANVEYIERVRGSRTVALKGHNPSDCLVLDRIEVLSNKEDTYSIMPIMKQVTDFCPMKMVPFTHEVEIPDSIKRDKVLLHVRSMDGKSVNQVFREEM